MLILILCVLGLFVVQTLIAPSIRFTQRGQDVGKNLIIALRARDNQPEMPLIGARADRALRNMQEALPVFLTVAILHIVFDSTAGLATIGAMVFLGARILYVPAYLSNILGVRSLTWVISWVGLGLMIAAFWLPGS